MALETRKLTGKPPWPITLLAGGEKPSMKKSRLAQIVTPVEKVAMPLRFWDKVDFTEDCWLWTGATSGGERPYGVSWNGNRRVKAHRWAFESTYGELGEGMEPDHLCRRPLCVRPSHMEGVTQHENVMRSDAPGPKAVRTNRCKRGHEFTPENTTIRGPRHRECAACSCIHRANARVRRSERRRIAREQRRVAV